MPDIKFATADVSAMKLGTTNVTKVMLGTVEIWPGLACTDVLTEPFNNLANWTTIAGTPSIVSGRNGTALALTGSATVRHTFPVPAQSEYATVGFAYRTNNFTLDRPLCEMMHSGAPVQGLRVNTNGSLSVTRGGAAATALATSATGLIITDTWYYIELQTRIHDTAGSMVVRVNGIERLNFTGDTRPGGGAVFEALDLPVTSLGEGRWDDLYLSTGPGCAFKGDLNPPPFPTTINWHSMLWASDPSWTPPADGAAVSSWRNGGTSSATATQATGANQPTYRAAFANLNGKPAVQFDGSNDYLDTSSASISQPNHVFVVGWLDPTHGTSLTICDSVSSSTRGLLRNRGTGSNIAIYAGGSGLGTTTGGGIDGSFALSCLFNGSSSSTARMNGTAYSFSGDSGSHSFAQLRIGADCTGGEPYKGAVAFLGVKDIALTAGEISDLETWARSFYGTP